MFSYAPAPISAPCCTAPVPTAALTPSSPAFLAAICLAATWAASLAAPLATNVAASRAVIPAAVSAAVPPPVNKAGIICGICSTKNPTSKAGSLIVSPKAVAPAAICPVFSASCTFCALASSLALSAGDSISSPYFLMSSPAPSRPVLEKSPVAKPYN